MCVYNNLTAFVYRLVHSFITETLTLLSKQPRMLGFIHLGQNRVKPSHNRPCPFPHPLLILLNNLWQILGVKLVRMPPLDMLLHAILIRLVAILLSVTRLGKQVRMDHRLPDILRALWTPHHRPGERLPPEHLERVQILPPRLVGLVQLDHLLLG